MKAANFGSLSGLEWVETCRLSCFFALAAAGVHTTMTRIAVQRTRAGFPEKCPSCSVAVYGVG